MNEIQALYVIGVPTAIIITVLYHTRDNPMTFPSFDTPLQQAAFIAGILSYVWVLYSWLLTDNGVSWQALAAAGISTVLILDGWFKISSWRV